MGYGPSVFGSTSIVLFRLPANRWNFQLSLRGVHDASSAGGMCSATVQERVMYQVKDGKKDKFEQQEKALLQPEGIQPSAHLRLFPTLTGRLRETHPDAVKGEVAVCLPPLTTGIITAAAVAAAAAFSLPVNSTSKCLAATHSGPGPRETEARPTFCHTVSDFLFNLGCLSTSIL